MSINYPDSFKNIDWVEKQINSELAKLKNDLTPEGKHFVQENGKYDIDLTKNYLENIQNKSLEDLKSNNSSAWIMAVQIALDYLGYFKEGANKRIDGIFKTGGDTQNAILNFQKQQNNPNITSNGIPNPEIIKLIIKELNTKLDPNSRKSKYTQIKNLSSDIFIAKNPDNTRNLINQHGKEINSTKYDFIFTPSPEGVAFSRSGGKYGLINTQGETIIEPKYSRCSFKFSEGLATVGLDGKFGFIDQNGDKKIGLQYEDALNFSEGLAAVKIDGKYGFIDKNGHLAIQAIYDKVPGKFFKQGKTKVSQGNKTFTINSKGEKILE